MGAQWQWRKHVETKQCPVATNARTAEAEEHVPEAFHSLRSCKRTQPSRSGPREVKSRRHEFVRHRQDENTIFVYEEIVYREPREPITCSHDPRAIEPTRGVAPTCFQENTRSTSIRLGSALAPWLPYPWDVSCTTS